MVRFNRHLILGVSSAALLFSAPLSGHAMLATSIQPTSQVQSDSGSEDKTFDPIAFVKRVIYPPTAPAKPKK